MNVAPTTTSPSSAPKADPASAPTAARMTPDGAGTDLPADATKGTPGDTFGRMLSRGMAGLDEVLQGKAGKPSSPIEPGLPLNDDTAPDPSAVGSDPTDRGHRVRVAVTDLVDVGTARSAKTGDDTADDALAVPDGGRHDDAAANDLAAQLALVSQWAGLAKAPASQGAQGGDGLDLRDKLATVRGTAVQTATAAKSRATVQVDVGADQPQDAASLSFAAGRPPLGGGRGVDVGPMTPATGKTESIARSSVESTGLVAEPGTVRAPIESVVAPTGAFALQVAAATQATTPLSADAAVPVWNIREQVGTPAWSHEVGQATLRIATSDLQSASLQINPEHLGPVDVQVRIDNGIAHLSFAAAHADTRQAIEASRATLDRMFTDQGLKIGDCAVGDSSTPRRQADADASLSGQSQRNAGGRWDQAPGIAAADSGPATTLTTRLKALGLVDTFA